MSNFSVLPPEVNSALMFRGPGPGPLLAAAASWTGLGQELATTADAFAALTSGVTGVWQGPTATAMANMAASYVGWLEAAATGAAQAADKATQSAAEFEAALAAIVHPEVVAANRSRLAALVASNLFGQNATTIAATEAHYEQMWAQDVTAMASYHAGSSAAVGQLMPWQKLLNGLSGQGAGPNALGAVLPNAASDVTLVIGGSGFPIPSQSYVETVLADYVTPNFSGFTLANALSLATPAESYWLTGVKSLTEDASWAQGLTILDNAINAQLAAGNNVVVQGYSQGAGIASLEMSNLKAEGVLSGSVNFSLVGNPMNPNGGLYSRFDGLLLPSLGKDFPGSTPDNYYQTAIYTLEYDGFADFPQYPINIVSDANAMLGAYYIHTLYPTLTTAQLAPAFTLPTQGSTMTTYYMIPTDNLPLLDPLRALPLIGNPLADLVQPDLKVIVNLGYGNPDYGYSTGYANVPTPFGLLPHVGAGTVLTDLVNGTQQGVNSAAADMNAGGLPSLSHLLHLPAPSLSGLSNFTNALGSHSFGALGGLNPPNLSVSSIDSYIEGLQTANTNIANAITNVSASTYSALLPVADTLNAALTTIPSYDVNLFLDGVLQTINGDPAGIVNAIGYPIAADTGLLMFLGFLDIYDVVLALKSAVTGLA